MLVVYVTVVYMEGMYALMGHGGQLCIKVYQAPGGPGCSESASFLV